MNPLPPALLIAAQLLAGCVSQPSLNAGVSLTSGGVHVYPSAAARLGRVRVAVSP